VRLPIPTANLTDFSEVLPFEDSVVCIEVSLVVGIKSRADEQMDGKGIWDTMEGALSKWPAQEG
jgi:5'-nucleotidase